MKRILVLALVAIGAVGTARLSAAEKAASADKATAAAPAKPAEPETYRLRYKFHPGQVLRWDVSHEATVLTTMNHTSQEVETVTTSVKVWQVTGVDAQGLATFEHRVDSIDMRQRVDGRPPRHYNSRTDKIPPPGFEDVAKSVGVRLVTVTMDDTGTITKRDRAKLSNANPAADTQMTLPLPKEAVSVGYVWKVPNEVDVRTPSGLSQHVKIEQRFTLEDVKTGVATISAATRVLTPIHDPAIEAQLTQQEATGKVRFDVDAGCVLWQQIDRDKRVIGFRGAASSIHYLTRFTETLLPEAPKVAGIGG